LNLLKTRNYPPGIQFAVSIGLVLVIAAACYSTSHLLGYRVVALILLMTASIIAMLFDILPVLTAAILSAITWNFFFIPPLYTFRIDNAEDALMFLLYFVIALLNAVLTFKIRDAEKKARDKEDKENSIRLYNTLLNSLSHELRTPIASIVGAVDTLQENNDRLTAANRQELLSQIDMASMRLNQEVENLLSMSRLESGMLKLNLDWCDTNELIFLVIQKLSASAQHHSIVFTPTDDLPLFKLDKGLIEQVIHSLLNNAIQHTPRHSIISIDAAFQHDHCVISISDNGPGFPEPEISHVFDKFYRLPQSKPGGSGLGLSIAKGFTEAHGGKISLENIKEGGAKFTIHIPAEASFINSLKHE
jgi:two-component system sensor histidine kinase KdpD